jgi:hypothetical protein
VDSISLVLDFTSCLLGRGENPFGEALVEMKKKKKNMALGRI